MIIHVSGGKGGIYGVFGGWCGSCSGSDGSNGSFGTSGCLYYNGTASNSGSGVFFVFFLWLRLIIFNGGSYGANC